MLKRERAGNKTSSVITQGVICLILADTQITTYLVSIYSVNIAILAYPPVICLNQFNKDLNK